MRLLRALVLFALVLLARMLGAQSSSPPSTAAQRQAALDTAAALYRAIAGAIVEDSVRGVYMQHELHAAADTVTGPVVVMGERFASDRAFPALDRGAVFGFKLALQQAGEYLFLVGCDRDCSAITAEVATEAKVDQGQVSGGRPNIPFHVPSPGIYIFRVRMDECANAPCSFGWRLIRRGTQASP
jgi:hypothetical protein